MNDTTCPWCETALVLDARDDGQTCPECLTSWRYEDEYEDVAELPLAA